jgi:hypothetical protein
LHSSRTPILLLSLSAICIASVFGILYDFFVINPKPEGNASAETISKYEVSALIDSALNAEIITPTASFPSEINSPFRPQRFEPAVIVPKAAVTPPPAAPKRSPLRLRGLMRNPSLAIIEDAAGETYIRAQGDYVKEALIVSIKNNSVTFKDSSGSFELMVEENR